MRKWQWMMWRLLGCATALLLSAYQEMIEFGVHSVSLPIGRPLL